MYIYNIRQTDGQTTFRLIETDFLFENNFQLFELQAAAVTKLMWILHNHSLGSHLMGAAPRKS